MDPSQENDTNFKNTLSARFRLQSVVQRLVLHLLQKCTVCKVLYALN